LLVGVVVLLRLSYLVRCVAVSVWPVVLQMVVACSGSGVRQFSFVLT
jgi:hypothetical protein